MHIYERISGESGKEYALRVIKNNIVSLELAPGATFSANDLAVELGMSKTPVREALTELSKMGIVEIFPQTGSRVSLVDKDMVEESRFMRLTLECAVVCLVCERASAVDLLRLQDNINQEQFYLENRMHEDLLHLDNEFHKALFRIANKMHMYDLMEEFAIHFDRIRSLRLIADKDVNVVQDHQKIYEAIYNKDAEEASRMMRIHLLRYKLDEEELKKKYKDYFV